MTYVSLFAGAGAEFLQLRRPGLMPVVAWMGGKRRLAPAILRALGLAPGDDADRYILCDAGPWGKVWPALLDPARCARVCATLRGWDDGGDIRRLWFDLRDAGPLPDHDEWVAQWLVLQSRAGSGVPVFWSNEELLQGNRPGTAYPAAQTKASVLLQGSAAGRPDQPAGQRDVLLACDGRGVYRGAGHKGDPSAARRKRAGQKTQNAAGGGRTRPGLHDRRARGGGLRGVRGRRRPRPPRLGRGPARPPRRPRMARLRGPAVPRRDLLRVRLPPRPRRPPGAALGPRRRAGGRERGRVPGAGPRPLLARGGCDRGGAEPEARVDHA